MGLINACTQRRPNQSTQTDLIRPINPAILHRNPQTSYSHETGTGPPPRRGRHGVPGKGAGPTGRAKGPARENDDACLDAACRPHGRHSADMRAPCYHRHARGGCVDQGQGQGQPPCAGWVMTAPCVCVCACPCLEHICTSMDDGFLRPHPTPSIQTGAPGLPPDAPEQQGGPPLLRLRRVAGHDPGGGGTPAR